MQQLAAVCRIKALWRLRCCALAVCGYGEGGREAEAARIDRQLIGRCGRQGDPGSFEIVASLEDELITVFVPSLKAMLDPARSDHHPFPRNVARVTRWYAQARAQRLHYRMRRATLRLQDELDKALAFAKPE